MTNFVQGTLHIGGYCSDNSVYLGSTTLVVVGLNPTNENSCCDRSGQTCMPKSNQQPDEHPVPHHLFVAAVQPVQFRIFEQNSLRKCLLGQAVNDDRHRRVDGVEQEQEDALEEGRAGEV